MPVNVYGASKAMGETLAHLACYYVVMLRVASLFGVAGASGTDGNFVGTIIRVGREKGGAPGRRRPSHVPDRHR